MVFDPRSRQFVFAGGKQRLPGGDYTSRTVSDIFTISLDASPVALTRHGNTDNGEVTYSFETAPHCTDTNWSVNCYDSSGTEYWKEVGTSCDIPDGPYTNSDQCAPDAHVHDCDLAEDYGKHCRSKDEACGGDHASTYFGKGNSGPAYTGMILSGSAGRSVHLCGGSVGCFGSSTDCEDYDEMYPEWMPSSGTTPHGPMGYMFAAQAVCEGLSGETIELNTSKLRPTGWPNNASFGMFGGAWAPVNQYYDRASRTTRIDSLVALVMGGSGAQIAPPKWSHEVDQHLDSGSCYYLSSHWKPTKPLGCTGVLPVFPLTSIDLGAVRKFQVEDGSYFRSSVAGTNAGPGRVAFVGGWIGAGGASSPSPYVNEVVIVEQKEDGSFKAPASRTALSNVTQ